MLKRVNGHLADALTEGSGGERMFKELEQVHAFVVALDARGFPVEAIRHAQAPAHRSGHYACPRRRSFGMAV